MYALGDTEINSLLLLQVNLDSFANHGNYFSQLMSSEELLLQISRKYSLPLKRNRSVFPSDSVV